MSVCLSNIKLRVCVVKSMCGQEYVWTDQRTRQSKISKYEIKGLLNLDDIFDTDITLENLEPQIKLSKVQVVRLSTPKTNKMMSIYEQLL